MVTEGFVVGEGEVGWKRHGGPFWGAGVLCFSGQVFSG